MKRPAFELLWILPRVFVDPSTTPPQLKETIQPVPFENMPKAIPSPETVRDSVEELKALSQQLFDDDYPQPAVDKSTHLEKDLAVQRSILTEEEQ